MNLEHEQVVQHQSRTGEDRYIGGRSNRYCVTEIASLYYTFLFLRFFFSFFPFYLISSSRFILGLYFFSFLVIDSFGTYDAVRTVRIARD